jgi:hypothetical protein
MATSKKVKSVIKGIKKSLKKKDFEVVSIRIKKIPEKRKPKKKVVARILNPVTGRLITKEGPRYYELISEGYVFRVLRRKTKTRIAGFLIPPERVVKTIAKSRNVSTKRVKEEIAKNINKQMPEEPKESAGAKLGSFFSGIGSSIISGGANNNKGAGVIGRENTNLVNQNRNIRNRGETTAENNNEARRKREENNNEARRKREENNNEARRREENNEERRKRGAGVIGQEKSVNVVQNGGGNGGGLVRNNNARQTAPVERKPNNMTGIKRNNRNGMVRTGGEGAVMGKPQEGYKQKAPTPNSEFDRMLVAEGSKINAQ